MDIFEFINVCKTHFPTLKIKYKDESLLMKILSYLMFFNNKFMTEYITTIGSTVYFPSRSKISLKPTSSAIILLHELVHIYDANKISTILFSFLYLFPQILAPFSLLLFLINWKIAVPAFILFCLPLPAYFRMYYEKRAYLTSLYAIKTLSVKLKFPSLLQTQKEYFLRQFNTAAYYYMWIFKGIRKDFDEAIEKINNGQRPFEGKILNILDELMSKIETLK